MDKKRHRGGDIRNVCRELNKPGGKIELLPTPESPKEMRFIVLLKALSSKTLKQELEAHPNVMVKV
jgi:hypothetical protein